jgi:hypothetical protein
MEQVVIDALAQIATGYSTLGVLGALGALLAAIVGVAKLPPIQGLLPRRLRWESLPKLGRIGIVFGAGALGSGLVAVAGGMALGPALVAGLLAGLTAIGTNETYRAVRPKKPGTPSRSSDEPPDDVDAGDSEPRRYAPSISRPSSIRSPIKAP